MTRSKSDLILDSLAVATTPLCDDCLAATAGISPRQTVFRLSTALAGQGRVIRRRQTCGACGKTKNTSSASATAPLQRARREPVQTDTAGATRDPDRRRSGDKPWHWEGHVQAALEAWLKTQGWRVTATADTASKEPGIDIVATKNGRWLAVEVKGYPSKTYEYGPRRGEPKPTSPSNQARQWFSHALLSMMLLRHKRTDAEIAVCIPDFKTFRRLASGTRACFETLGFGIYFVGQDGQVMPEMPHRPV